MKKFIIQTLIDLWNPRAFISSVVITALPLAVAALHVVEVLTIFRLRDQIY